MATPILYIGLGTSGLRMLEEAQRFFYSCSPTNECRPSHTRFLFVETDATTTPARILGGPAKGKAIEEVRTPIPAAQISVGQLEKRATVRIFSGSETPPDSKTILRIQEHRLIAVPLDRLALPQAVYVHYAHIFDMDANKVPDASHRPMDTWVQQLKLSDGSISVRLREDLGNRDADRPILEVYLPEMPEDYKRRFEILFTGVELVHMDGVVKWLPPADKLTFASAGAGGMRSFGRIALWGESDQGEGRYMFLLRKEIERLYTELLLTNPNQKVKPLIYVCGTFTGGTSSGMFIDVAYLCRDVIDDSHVLNANVLGLFLLPPGNSQDLLRVSNAYACLRDLRHFSTESSQFLASWPLNVGVNAFPQGRTPYELTTLLSLSWMPDGVISSLYRVAGLVLFLFGTKLGDYRKSKIVDVVPGSTKVWKFSALGMTSHFYPRGEIRQCAASKFARDFLIDRWLLPNESRGLGAGRLLKGNINAIPHDAAMDLIKPRLRRGLNAALDTVVEKMLSDGPGNQNAIESVHAYLERVRQKKDDFTRAELLTRLGESGEFYTRWKGRIKLTVEELYELIGEKIIAEIETYENLPLARKIVGATADVIDQILDFWKPLSVENWNNAMTKGNPKAGHLPLVDQLLENSGRALGQARAIRLNRFEEILRRMCISLLREPLEKLAKYLRDGSLDPFTPRDATPNPASIPSVEAVRQAEAFVADLKTSLLAFEKEVRSGVIANDVIHYHLRTGRFQGEQDEQGRLTGQPGDVDETSQLFESKHTLSLATDENTVSHSTILLGYGAKKLWGYLASGMGASHAILAGEMIGSLSSALKREGLPDAGKTEAAAASNHLQLATLAQHSKSKMSVNLGVDAGMLHNAPNFPKMFVTGDPHALTTIDASLKNANVTGFVEQPDACDPLLGDMIVFWDERPVAELDNLAKIDQWSVTYGARKAADPTVDCYIHT